MASKQCATGERSWKLDERSSSWWSRCHSFGPWLEFSGTHSQKKTKEGKKKGKSHQFNAKRKRKGESHLNQIHWLTQTNQAQTEVRAFHWLIQMGTTTSAGLTEALAQLLFANAMEFWQFHGILLLHLRCEHSQCLDRQVS